MSAFVQLRILGSEILDLFWIDPVASAAQSITKNEVILKLFNGDLDRWEVKWYKTIEDASNNVCHRFIIRFYGTHLRLLLHSFRLQLSILSGSISKQALWVCYTSSLDMLHLVVDSLGSTSHLYYCQDSVHVMVAYAAVVMIKILLSLPGELPSESESMVLDLINQTSQNFSNQCPATNTSSYYQCRFLANVVAQYQKSKGESYSAANQWLRQQQHQILDTPENQRQLPPLPMHHQQQGYTGSQQSNSPSQTFQTSPSSSSVRIPTQHQSVDSHKQLPYNHAFNHDNNNNQQPQTQSRNHYPHHQHVPQPTIQPKSVKDPPVFATTMHNSLETLMAMDGQSNAIPLFTDNMVWEDLFANAGFNISSGAFLPKLAEG
ncbi:hypothetical protein FQN52_007323 [Onygenales sp. PD_12]|nr:hypothetical protein FQN52_007323 [Onygenales sp. PD_12]